jgi:hypothetical protein
LTSHRDANGVAGVNLPDEMPYIERAGLFAGSNR